VWLVRLKDAKSEDEDKVFALKILRKVDGTLDVVVLRPSKLMPCLSHPPQASRTRPQRAQRPRQGRGTPLHNDHGRELPIARIAVHGGAQLALEERRVGG
jgi:hypothetical protein